MIYGFDGQITDFLLNMLTKLNGLIIAINRIGFFQILPLYCNAT